MTFAGLDPAPDGSGVLVPGTALRAFAARIDLDALATALTDTVLHEVWPDRPTDGPFAATVRDQITQDLESVLERLAGVDEPTKARPRRAIHRSERLLRDADINVVERACLVAMRSFWREWLDIARMHATERSIDLAVLVGPAVDIALQYVIDRITALIAQHQPSPADWSPIDEHRRRLVDHLVDGASNADPDLAHELQYTLDGTHLAVVVHQARRSRAELTVRQLSAASGASESLLVPHRPQLWLSWLQLSREAAFAAREEIDRATRQSGLDVSIGAPAVGPAGFLRSRQDALDVAELRGTYTLGSGAIWFDDVRLELLLQGDSCGARRFVARVLGQLNDSGERASRAREALLVRLTTGSTVLTAARLRVHENTVRARIAWAEQTLPRHSTTDRSDILAALRLRNLVGDPPADRGGAPHAGA